MHCCLLFLPCLKSGQNSLIDFIGLGLPSAQTKTWDFSTSVTMVIYINSRDQWHGLGMIWMVSLCATIISFAYIYTYSLKVRPEAIVNWDTGEKKY